VLAALLAPAAARAAGDPASDYLLTQAVFTPIDVTLPPASVEQLAEIQRDAKAKGYEVRVALIATRYDLGAVPTLFEKPQVYARFLWQEIRFVYHGPLLVVMPNGYGYWEQGGKVTMPRLPPPSSHTDLAAAAVPAVQALAKAHGVEVAIPPLRSQGGSPWRWVAIGVGAGVAALLVAGALVLRRRRTLSET
jgi:hypothetical protein